MTMNNNSQIVNTKSKILHVVLSNQGQVNVQKIRKQKFSRKPGIYKKWNPKHSGLQGRGYYGSIFKYENNPPLKKGVSNLNFLNPENEIKTNFKF